MGVEFNSFFVEYIPLLPQCLERYLIENPPGSPAAMNGKCQLVVEKWELIALQETTTLNNMIKIIH